MSALELEHYEPFYEIPITVNFERLMTLPEGIDIVSLEGSTRSSKTISIVQFLIQTMMSKPGTVVRCYRENGTTHEDTTIDDFRFVMKQYGYRHFNLPQPMLVNTLTGAIEMIEPLPDHEMKAAEFWDLMGKWNAQKKRYTFNNGSFIRFEETRNIKQKHGRKAHISWLNEVMEISQEAWDQIEPRTSWLKIIDFNPSFNHHWLFESVHKLDNCKCYHSTYKDNPFLTPQQLFSIEKHKPTQENQNNGTADPWWWDVYGLGKRGKVEGVVYKLWGILDDDQWPQRMACNRFGYGLDFGFYPDPAALIEISFWNQALYWKEILYEHELLITPNQTRPEIPSIHQRLIEAGVSKEDRIYADNAQPGSIRDLKLMGWNIVPCIKGPDSIQHGIRLNSAYKIFVHRKSINLQTELEHYTWDKKLVAGETTWLNKPIDDWNHLLDPARYWAMGELNHERKQGQAGRRAGGRARTKQRR